MRKPVVAFGELLLRLSPPGYLRWTQASSFDINYTGAEANVCVALTNLGYPATFITKLPDNEISRAAMSFLRKHDVDLKQIVFGGERIGMYYLERGASQRPSRIIYDRKQSAFATALAHDFRWQDILPGAGWFHFSGITAALSETMPQICADACSTARNLGIPVSCDLNYRRLLWGPEKAAAVMKKLVPLCDVVIGNEEDAELCLGIRPGASNAVTGKLDRDGYVEAAECICSLYDVKKVAFTLRESLSASDNNWSGFLFDGQRACFSKTYGIHLIDRVGGGDSFSAGLIHALLQDKDSQYAVDFATAVSCLKQTMEFDFSLVTVRDAEDLMAGDDTGRVQR